MVHTLMRITTTTVATPGAKRLSSPRRDHSNGANEFGQMVQTTR